MYPAETLSFTKIIIKIIEIEIKSEKTALIRNQWICAMISSEIYLRKCLERFHSKIHWLPNSCSFDFMMQTYAFDHEVPVVHYQFSIFQFSNGFTGSEIVSIDLNNILNSVIQKFLNFCSPREFGTTIMANFEVFNSLWKASSGKEWSWFPKWVEFIRLYPVQISE